MSKITIAETEDAYAERWRLWELAGTESNRKTAKRARIAFVVVMTALVASLLFQLLSSQPWA